MPSKNLSTQRAHSTTLSDQGASAPTGGRLSARYDEVDVFRGIAVCGVVLSHTAIGLASAGVIDHNSALFTFNSWMLQFRMPAIALVIGLFIPAGVRKYGSYEYLGRRVIFAVYIYTLWYVLQMSFELATSSIKNNPVGFNDVLAFWETDSQLWFIPYIAVSATILVLLKPWSRLPPFNLALLMLGSVMVWGWQVDMVGLRGLSLVGFTALGSVIGIARFGTWLRHHPGRVVITGLVAGATSLAFWGVPMVPTSIPVPVSMQHQHAGTWLPQSVSVAYLGLLLLCAASVILVRVPWLSRALVYVGQQTLPIYLAHVILVAGARTILLKFGMSDARVLLPLLLGMGVCGPLIINYISPTLRMSWLFNVPQKWLPGRVAA